MGVVYRARYVVNGRQVALKMLPEDVTDKTALARFEREVEVLKTLRHPNIVRCFGGVCEDKRRFYAMELLEGGSLEDKLQERGRLPWEQVVQFGLQMCGALECSHAKGIVHRDIKPSNFLMSPNGQIKLSDFGLASVVSSRKITAAGKTAGTFLYMAPEQIRGQEVTPRTDLYALGCVLYELVTGEVPFLGETAGATLHLHCFTPPGRPSEKALDLPIALERIILRLLEKDPEDRPASATEVSNELRQVSQTVSVIATRQERRLSPPDPPQTLAGRQKKTSPLHRRSAPLWFTGMLAAALCLSLVGNLLQALPAQSAGEWERLWVAASSDADAAIRLLAVSSLSEMASDHPASVAALRERLRDSDLNVRMAAVRGLGRAGSSARPAVGELMGLQKNDPFEEVRVAAQDSLQEIRREGAARFPWGTLLLTSVVVIGAAIGLFWWLRTAEGASRTGGPVV